MGTKLSLENFEEIYNSTYNATLKYIICKCSNIEDINDLLQETYVELYKTLKRKEYIELENYQNYILGIAKRSIQKHYGLIYKLKIFSIWNSKEEHEIELPADFDLEMETIKKLNAEAVWKYIKQKNMKVVQVFYLYYYSDYKISQIAKELNLSESNVKNILYRTIKEIKLKLQKEGDISA